MNSDFENRMTGDSPFKPAFEDYIGSHPGRGSLKIQVSTANQSFPVKGVYVDVAWKKDGVRYTLYHDVTDSSGIVDEIVLPCCMGGDNNDPATAGKGDDAYLVSIYHPAFREITDFPVTIQDRVESILPVSLEPLSGEEEAQ